MTKFCTLGQSFIAIPWGYFELDIKTNRPVGVGLSMFTHYVRRVNLIKDGLLVPYIVAPLLRPFRKILGSCSVCKKLGRNVRPHVHGISQNISSQRLQCFGKSFRLTLNQFKSRSSLNLTRMFIVCSNYQFKVKFATVPSSIVCV